MQTKLFMLCICMASYLYGTAQPNNNCANATPITQLNGTCQNGFDITGATEDIGPSACTDPASNNENVWFSFVAQGVSAEIQIISGVGVPEITLLQFTTPCVAASALEIECIAGNTLVTDGELVIGQTYYVMVAFSNNQDGLFDICIDNPVPAPNDACTNATPITNLDQACVNGNNNFPATDILTPTCFTGSTYNVWYSFVAQGVSLDVYIPSGPGVAQIAVIDFVTPCNATGALQLGCATGTNHIILDNDLVIGQTYHIVVGFQNSNFSGAGIGAYELCIDNPEPAPNDDCNTAIVVPPSVLSDPLTCFTTIAGNPLNNDWPSTDVGTFGCWNPGDTWNIWYSFVAQGNDVQITVDPGFPEAAQIALVQYTGNPCELAGAQLLACANDAVLDYNDNLVIGNTYYVAVGFEDNEIGDFCMNIFNPVPPDNDQPCDAEVLPTDNSCEDGTTIYANPENWFVPGSCASAIQNTVWYQISLSDPDNVGFEIDFELDDFGPNTQVSLILWELNNCNVPGQIAFFQCGDPPTEPIQWGPIDDATTYYLSVSTSEADESDFEICVDEVPPCFMNDICDEAELIPNVISDMAFVCVPGCNLFADPETLYANGCEIQNFPTVWFQVPTDGQATLMNIQVQSDDFDAPTISLFQQITNCTDLQPVGLTDGNLACIVGSNGEAEAFGTDVGANQVYYIAVSSLNNVGGDFEICVNTISQASACVTSQSIEITSRSFGGPLTGPFLPGETIGVCMNVNSYTAAGNGCQWFQGLIPVFGNGWDPSSFDANGQPMNATVNGNAMGVAGNGLYGASTFDWFTDVDYHYDNFQYQIGDFDGNGTVEICNLLYDPDCPNLGGITGGCCGPCWGTPLGDILPGGWFAYGINGTCPTPGPPIRVDWGDGNTCGGGMGPWNFCFELTIRPYPDCLEDASTMNLMLGFITTADGETGSWTGSASVCALDQPASVTFPMCCTELEEAEEELDPICSGQQFVYVIDEPDVDFWQWEVNAGTVTGGTPGSGGPGTVVINTLVNGGSDPEIVEYTFLGFAGGACPVFQKIVTIEVFPEITVDMDPVLWCATPETAYTLTPEVMGGSGNYDYQWAPNGETTSSITVANPVNGTTYIVTVTDDVGCVGTESLSIQVYTTFPVDIIAPVTEQCVELGTIDLEATASGGLGGYTFEWSFPDNTTTNNNPIMSDQSGQHLVEVTDDEGCVGKDSVVLEFFETPEVYVDAVDGALAICEGESTELAGVATGGESPYIYEWDTPEGPESGKNIEAFTPGIYVVTVEDINGCTNSAEIEIEAQPQPAPDLGPDLVVCNFDDPVEIEEQAGPWEEYQWSVGSFADGETSIEVYNAGTYTITVTNEFGCTGTASMEITTFPEPPFPMPDTFEVCPGQQITLDADDYNGPWENVQWLQCGGCSFTFTPPGPGEYDVIVWDINGCQVQHEFHVVEAPDIDPGMAGDNVICTGETITLSAQAGFTSYQWSSNVSSSSGNTADVTSPGTYYVTVEDALGCSGADSIIVTSGDFTFNITGPTAICANVQATLNAGAGYTSYMWSTGETTPTIMVEEGTHSVTVTNSFGCVSSASIDIIETPFIPVITGDNQICPTSETSTLDAGGPYASYTWSANAGGATTQTVVVSAPGSYTVTVVDQSGCVGNAAFTLTHHAVPFVAINGILDFCVGGDTEIYATSGYPGYTWSTTATTDTITVNTAGPYSVTITDANGCTNTATTTVNPPYQETVDISGSFVFCPGDQATMEVPAGYASVLWSTNETTDQISVGFEGQVSVIVVDSDGCIAYDTVQTDENSLLSPVITGQAAICDNGNALLNAGPGFDNYVWSTSETTQTITVNAAGTYTVTVSSNAGCVGTDDFTVVGYSSPTATVTPTATACDIQEPGGPSTSVNFNGLVTGGDTGGSWTQSSGPSPVNLSNLNNVNFNGLNAGTYTFTYTTNSATPPCAESSYTVTVTVTSCACPSVDLFNAPDLCNDLGTITLSSLVLPTTPGPGTWTITGTPAGSNPAVIIGGEFDASNADPGTYTLQYTVTGLPAYCDDDASVTVNVLKNPVAGIAAAPLQYCAGENDVVGLVTLLTGADPGGMWIETSPVPSTGGAFNQGAGTFNTAGQAPGTYTFDYIITGPGPCPDDVTTVEVVIEANPVADAGSTATLDCTTPNATLGGPGTSLGPDFSYSWTTPDGALSDPNIPNPVATSAGTYILTVMNNVTGCSATDQVVIDQNGDFPTDLDLLVQSPDCVGDPPGSMQVSFVEGGTAPYQYSLNGAPPVASPVFNNLAAGDYTIHVTDAAGCEISEDFTILDLVAVDIEILYDTLVFGLGDTITFSYVYTGTNNTPDSIVWKLRDSVIATNQLEINFEAYLAGTVTVEAWDVRGCYTEESVSFQVVRKRDVYIPNVFSPNQDGLNDYFTLYTDSDAFITLMEIYTRWGDLVYRRTNFDPNVDPLGWDGTFRGERVNPGVYVYRIEIIYGDGLRDSHAGDITVIR